MTTAWSYLPNAKHIDRILASFAVNTSVWDDIGNSYTDDTGAWKQTERSLSEDLRKIYIVIRTHIDDIQPIRQGTGWSAACDATVALIAHSDCGYMLDSDPGELAIIAKFDDVRARLLLPACIVFVKEKELV